MRSPYIISDSDWEWYPYAGHFAKAQYCLFSLHTHIGDACISTVGHYIPPDSPDNSDSPDKGHGRWKLHAIGDSGALFESRVLKVDEDGEPEEGGEPMTVIQYGSAILATAGHLELCRNVQDLADSEDGFDNDEDESEDD